MLKECVGCDKYKEPEKFLQIEAIMREYWELKCSLCLLKQYMCEESSKGKFERDDSVKIYARFLDEQLRADKWKFATIALSIILVVVILGMGQNA